MWPFGKRPEAEPLDERIERYARQALPARLGLPPAPARAVRVRRFPRGRASTVRRVELEGWGQVVLRVLSRRRHRRRLAGRQRLAAVLAAGGIPVPRLLLADGTAATWRAYGFGVVAEEFVPGRSLAELAPEARPAALRRLADVLARLHGIRHLRPGKAWEGERRHVARWARRRCAAWVERLRRAGLGLPRSRGRALCRWFPEQFHALEGADYPLIHGDPSGHNVLVAEDGKVHLLDFGWAAHWFAQRDLVVGEHWAEELAPGQGPAFLDRYFAQGRAPRLAREEYERTRALFFAWFALHCSANRARRACRRRARHEAAGQMLAEARRLWSLAERFLDEAGAP